MTAKKNDDDKTDEVVPSASAGSTGEEPTAQEAVAVVDPAPVSAVASPGLLEEAVVQIQKLAELREQEVRRQERLITQMQEVVERHSRTNRALLCIAAFTLLLVTLLTIGIMKIGADQADRAHQMGAATYEIRRTVAAIKNASGRIDNLQLGLTTKLDNTVDAMRRERDEIKAEVRTVLDNHNENMITRELALKEEEARLVTETARVKQERITIIGDAITRLEAVAGELSSTESAPQMEITGAERKPAPARTLVDAPDPDDAGAPDAAPEPGMPEPVAAPSDQASETGGDAEAAEDVTAEAGDTGVTTGEKTTASE